jgi:hypothetical protein
MDNVVINVIEQPVEVEVNITEIPDEIDINVIEGAAVWGAITGTLSDQTDLQAALNAKQDLLGYTPEDVANKRTSFQAVPDNTHYPSEKLVKDQLDLKQDVLGFTPEDVANRLSAFQGSPDDNHYVTEKLVKDNLDALTASLLLTLLRDGSRSLTADWNAGAFKITAKGFIGAGALQPGDIIPYVKNFTTPSLTLPEWRQECNGQLDTDPESDFFGRTLPLINGTSDSNRRFLRGNRTSGGTGGNYRGRHTHPVSAARSNFLTAGSAAGASAITQVYLGQADSREPYYDVVYTIVTKVNY